VTVRPPLSMRSDSEPAVRACAVAVRHGACRFMNQSPSVQPASGWAALLVSGTKVLCVPDCDHHDHPRRCRETRRRGTFHSRQRRWSTERASQCPRQRPCSSWAPRAYPGVPVALHAVHGECTHWQASDTVPGTGRNRGARKLNVGVGPQLRRDRAASGGPASASASGA
jgi:hypothetical protein